MLQLVRQRRAGMQPWSSYSPSAGPARGNWWEPEVIKLEMGGGERQKRPPLCALWMVILPTFNPGISKRAQQCTMRSALS